MRAAVLLAALIMTAIGARASNASTLGYDPKADPFAQYAQAIVAAQAQRKLVLVIAGGDWCRWCHVLERFLQRHADVKAGLDAAFVVMKVYVGDENYNEDFFAQLPQARGAPHFWIVSPQRHVLSSQSTGAFERGRHGYDKEEFLGFIEQWRQRASSAHAATSD